MPTLTKRAAIAAAAIALVAPGVALTSVAPAIAADPSCSYANPATTSVTITANQVVYTEGQTVSGHVNASSTAGTLPDGTLTVRIFKLNPQSNPTGNAVYTTSSPSVNAALQYAWATTNKDGGSGYRIVATYTTPNCQFRNSESTKDITLNDS